MATFQQLPDGGRPPDSPERKHITRKLCSNASISTWHTNTTTKRSYIVPSSDTDTRKRSYGVGCAEYNNSYFDSELVEDMNKNVQETIKRTNMTHYATTKSEKNGLKQSLPKLLCLKKSSSASALRTLNVSALRTTDDFNSNRYYNITERTAESPETVDNGGCSSVISTETSRQKNRNSFHQNVEEALSSLLWQPYEYQNSGSLSSSSCSSPSSSFGDLDEITKNGGTSQRCSFTDLHLPTPTSEMVINLPVHNSTGQWRPPPPSRDPHTIRSTSWLSDTFSSAEVSLECITDACIDASDVNSGDMQVNVSSNTPGVHQSNVVNITAAENGVRNSASSQQQQNIFASNLNLSSANVVGLPNHVRYASVPVSTIQNNRPTGSGTVFPNHSRHISEPSSQFLKYNNGFSQQGNVVPNHRHSSQVDQSNLHQISHFRSSSVPKSMPLVPRHESSTTTTMTTTVPSVHVNNSRFSQKMNPQQYNGNVSNVNVNFYRAVPVNVVSSVPTIHCLNTLSNVQGNDVSNVQVLPLGLNFQSQSTSSTTNNPSHVSGTTQVILHNTQMNTNSIQIPGQNVNNRNNVLDPQVVPVQPSRSTVSTSTITNFLPPPPVSTLSNHVVIQNTRPISSTMVPMMNTNPRAYTNAAINTVQVGTSSASTQNNNNRAPRTFTSTEAQTDEISVLPPAAVEPSSANREQRRRERRERRHQRRANSSTVHRNSVENGTQVNNLQNDRLPDLLNSHLPPPYTTLPNGAAPPPQVPPEMVRPPPPQMVRPPPPGAVLQTVVPNNIVPPSGFVFPPPPPVVPGQVPMVQGPSPVAVPVPSPGGFRFPFPATGFRRGRFSEEPPKGCCGLLSWKPGSLRWFIALIALVAVCCVLVGTALGAMRPAGRDHLTVSLLMIGVGIVLVTVSGVAWRLTSHDASVCRSMLGLGSSESVEAACGGARRFVPRLPPSYGRPHHPYAAMMYPEFQYRPPPPSYQASMQEYRLRLLLLDRGNTPQIREGIRDAVSPPPTYRSHAGSLLRAPLSSRRDAAQSEYSCPPSYRSQSTIRPGTLQSNSVLHSREQSLSLSESNHGGSVVNVVNILGSTEEDIALDNITLDSLKMEPESDINPVKMLLKGSSSELEGSKDGNLVTIVQTSDQSPVIVTVSGSSQIENSSSVQITEIPSEMEILAHL